MMGVFLEFEVAILLAFRLKCINYFKAYFDLGIVSSMYLIFVCITHHPTKHEEP